METHMTGRQDSILLGEKRSSSFQRVVARFIDLTVTAIVFFLGRAIWSPMGWFLGVGYAAVQDALGQGQSIGKKIMGLQVIEESSALPCSFSHSVFRNVPWILSLFLLPFPVVGILAQFVFLPVLFLEFYLLWALESGVRLGDVMGNTCVVEYMSDGDGAES